MNDSICYFSIGINQKISCNKEKTFDEDGFIKNECPEFPCDKYKALSYVGNNNLLIFLEQAGSGCISGNISEWPQLKPACKYAIEKIRYLEKENSDLRKNNKLLKKNAFRINNFLNL